MIETFIGSTSSRWINTYRDLINIILFDK